MNVVKDTKSLVAALRKAARKRRRIAEAAAIKRTKKRLLEVEEAAMAAEITAAADLALFTLQTKETKPILPGVSTGSYNGNQDSRRMYGQLPRERGGSTSTRLTTLIGATSTQNSPSVSIMVTPRGNNNNTNPQGGLPGDASANFTSSPYDFGIPGVHSPTHDFDQVMIMMVDGS